MEPDVTYLRSSRHDRAFHARDPAHHHAVKRCWKVQVADTGSIVSLGTQPSRPRAFRTQAQPLGSSMTRTVSGSPTIVASSVVSYGARTTAGSALASMCRAGTQPDPSLVVTKTKAGHVVPCSPACTF